MDEPIRTVNDVLISVHARESLGVGTARPAAVGAVVQVRPHVSLMVTLTYGEFDRLWSMALAGMLKHVHFGCTKPRYSSALVTDVIFSNKPIE